MGLRETVRMFPGRALCFLSQCHGCLGLPQVNRGGEIHREELLSRKCGFVKCSDLGHFGQRKQLGWGGCPGPKVACSLPSHGARWGAALGAGRPMGTL